MAQCMTLPNSITSLIQYRPPGPNNIVLNRFYCSCKDINLNILVLKMRNFNET
jgi:hypothetical protein